MLLLPTWLVCLGTEALTGYFCPHASPGYCFSWLWKKICGVDRGRYPMDGARPNSGERELKRPQTIRKQTAPDGLILIGREQESWSNEKRL